MEPRGRGRHRTGTRRAGRRVLGAVVAIIGLAVIAVVVVVRLPADSSPTGGHAPVGRSTVASPPFLATDPHPSGSGSSAPTSTHPASTHPASTHPASTRPAVPAVRTPEGMWWGVDSVEPISAASIANVAGWYTGAPRPQVWGRYLSGSYAVTPAELAYARSRNVYVYLIVNDRNCSQCGGGDVCGNDLTGVQAQSDARDAIAAARALRLPRATALYKDFEQVSSCRGEPTAAYLLGWYATMRASGFRVGFYGNVHEQSYDFPVAYCRALAQDPTLGVNVLLDMNEDEPLIGAPAGTTGPGNAPRFAPNSPSCAPPSATRIWQYGESLTPDNVTDIDQARPGTPGLLAPDGSVTV